MCWLVAIASAFIDGSGLAASSAIARTALSTRSEILTTGDANAPPAAPATTVPPA